MSGEGPRPADRRPENPTMHKELRITYYTDNYEGGAPLLMVQTAENETQVMPLSDVALIHHFTVLAGMVERRFKRKVGMTS